MDALTLIAISTIIGVIVVFSGEKQLNEPDQHQMGPYPPMFPPMNPNMDYSWHQHQMQAMQSMHYMDGYRRYSNFKTTMFAIVVFAVFLLLLKYPEVLSFLN